MLRKQVHFLSFVAAIGYAVAVAPARKDDSLSRDPRRGFSLGLACVRVNGKYGYVRWLSPSLFIGNATLPRRRLFRHGIRLAVTACISQNQFGQKAD